MPVFIMTKVYLNPSKYITRSCHVMKYIIYPLHTHTRLAYLRHYIATSNIPPFYILCIISHFNLCYNSPYICLKSYDLLLLCFCEYAHLFVVVTIYSITYCISYSIRHRNSWSHILISLVNNHMLFIVFRIT